MAMQQGATKGAPGTRPEGRPTYTPLHRLGPDAASGGVGPGPRSRPTRAAALVLTSALLLAGVILALAQGTGRRQEEVTAEAHHPSTFLEAAASRGSRKCVAMEGLRLSDGGGKQATLDNASPDECVETCRSQTTCAQAVYSWTNRGCYMFGKLNAKVYTGSGQDQVHFRSMFCGHAGSVERLEKMRADVERLAAASPFCRRCVTMDDLRFGDGSGKTETLNNASKEECVEACRLRTTCTQAVYSGGNRGCYMFEKVAAHLRFGGGSDQSGFRSIYCAGHGHQAEVELVRMKMEHLARQSAVAGTKQRWVEAEKQARALIASVGVQSKMSLVAGTGGNGYAGFVASNGMGSDVPQLRMNDGPQGYNGYQDSLRGLSTQFPSLLAVAASFNPETSRQYATAVAEEFVAKGSNVLLGPDVEVTRTTLSGRGFETISGEDPFLGSELVRPYVKAVQDKGIIATVKHWLDNNQEIYRQTMTAAVGERAQHEIYMPVFKAAFEAGAGGVMCSYNKINGEYACENSHLLKKLLREDLGFKGYVVSDWGATHDGKKSAINGLDIEMPTAEHFGSLYSMVPKGEVPEATLNDMATHVLSAMYFVGQFEGRFPADKNGNFIYTPTTSEAHDAVARNTIIDGGVLLKNERGALPIAASVKKLALIGNYCDQASDARFKQGGVYSGGGSGFVDTGRTITPLKAISLHYENTGVDVVHGRDGAAAEGADVAVICVAAHAEEGWDRANLTLPEATRLARQVRQTIGGKNVKIVLVAFSPGAITAEWAKEVDAVLLLFEPGEQVGPALAMILTGDASPAGRLPVSIPETTEQRFQQWQYPGVCANNTWCEWMTANFSEGTLVGYRWNEAKHMPSRFPFGFGLTYTEFKVSDLTTTCSGGMATVGFRVANVGDRDGLAVPQLYVGFESLKPVLKQLRGFRKLSVPAGGDDGVVFVLDEEDWSYFDEAKDQWVSALSKNERIQVWVGTSSADLPLTASLDCGASHVLVAK